MNIQTNLKDDLVSLKTEAEAAVRQAADKEALEAVRVQYIGRKGGRISEIMRGLKDLPHEDKPVVGALANEIQNAITALIDEKIEGFKHAEISEKLKTETIDVTMPGTGRAVGQVHPITQVIEELCAVFKGLGFAVIDDHVCPEIETDYYNFDALNFPPDHPARDMQDTYYTDVASNILLRSQTSNAQIHYMENHDISKGPVRVVAPGRVYRNEEVNSRKYVLFHQFEGLLVDEDVTFADLKGILHAFASTYFGGERPTRFRASFFPFTEPSAEMDVQCIFCSGKGCGTCSQRGWLEVLGSGMVDPNVLKNVNIDPERYTGFAFGMGVERLVMLKYAVSDIRMFFNGDLRFLKQFKGA